MGKMPEAQNFLIPPRTYVKFLHKEQLSGCKFENIIAFNFQQYWHQSDCTVAPIQVHILKLFKVPYKQSMINRDNFC